MKSTFALFLLLGLHGNYVFAELSFRGETIDEWHGFRQHRFHVDGCDALVVVPKTALSGKPWSWCMEFPDAFTDRCAAPQLLAAGFHHVYIVVGHNSYGSPAAMKHFQALYDLRIEKELGRAGRLA